MPSWKRLPLLAMAVAVLAAGCAASPATVSNVAGDSPTGERGAPKRIVFGSSWEPDPRPTARAQARGIYPLVNAGLTVPDPGGGRRPMLAETVPSLENGLWTLTPDGRMETIWKLRVGAQWHDGAPFTSDDLLFSLQVGRDPQLSAFSTAAYPMIDGLTAPDPRTLTVSWKEHRIDADALFNLQPLSPLPRHLLERAYRDDKAGFLDLSYWTQDYVGTGPFRVREWTPGVAVLLEANRDYVLGRPRLDAIEIRFIPDPNTLSANLLAGAVDLSSGVGSIDLGLQLRDQWRDGTVAFNFRADTWVAMFPQFVDPRPAVVADVRFRRALVHAIDRQEIVDTLVGGMSPVPHSFLNPNQDQYREIEAGIPRYDYDPSRAGQLMAELGFTKGPEGMYRDAAGQRLALEFRSAPAEQSAKPAATIVGHWTRFGVAANLVTLTQQRAQDFEYVATFPSFTVNNRAMDVDGLRFLHSSQTRLPANHFRVPGNGNTSRYMSPDFDAHLEAYFRTVPLPERTRVLGQVIHHIADQVTAVGLYYNANPGAISHRLLNVSNEWVAGLIGWNAHEWDIK